MHFINLPHACAILLAAWLGQGVMATAPQAHRMLRAATKRADLYKRSTRIMKRFDAEVAYVEEENGWRGVQTFASQVKVNSHKPVLNLEEVEHHLRGVQCGQGKMHLSFVDAVSARDAFFSCRGDDGGLIITSHDSCNTEGERAVYSVNDVSFSEDGKSLDLSVTEASWQDAFDKFDISFGHSTEDHLFRRHSDFAKIRKRQDRFRVAIPEDTPDNVNTGTFDLKSELIDFPFPFESFLAGLGNISPVPIPQLPIEIGCKNCSTRGQIILSQGAIQIDASQIDLIPDFLEGGDDGKEISNLITGGFVELAAVGVGARVELFARPKASGAFEIALFALPVLGFVIPGIGKAGAVFEPRLAADFSIGGGFEITYGVDIAIPDNSVARLELTDLGSSGVTGFQDTTLTALPFNVDIADIDIQLGLAFVPTIPVGFEFFNTLTAEVTLSMNLPRLDAKLSTNAAANCGGRSNSTLPDQLSPNIPTPDTGDIIALGPLALVEANVTITIDAGFTLEIPLLPPPFRDVNLNANLFTQVFPLVTECVDATKPPKPTVPRLGANHTAPVNTMSLGTNNTVYVSPMRPTAMLQWNATKTAMMPGHPMAPTHVVASSPIMAPSHAAVPSQAAASSHVLAAPYYPVVTGPPAAPYPIPQDSPKHNSSALLAHVSSEPCSNTSMAVGTASAPFALSPTSTVVISTGVINRSSGAALEQNAAPVFTGAAMRGVEASVRWGWQICVIGFGVGVGAVML
ncbi:hypothetical protein HBH56_020460 [Parastagonospora nodorum]|nr:hypothetical protein HBH56_020460 [Parastagonospora nodorum]KAH3937201.1 hypothetical protein HBH54_014050 [Parastagonospora nodorum]KAH3967739.1 hypothetical protein HBH51_137770 [Parastagonospora nodorum]KAH4059185.1 hypothetical protein HBH49_015010 [Parastagonospora nodorum]KAH4074642.1 hypothetical protein HBH50_028050 [Parastagonospora nodorum]